MDEEDQIAADFAPGLHDVPESVLTYDPAKDEMPDTFDESQRFLHGGGSPEQEHLAALQASEDKIRNWVSMFHGPEPKNLPSLRSQVDGGKISGADYFATTGRIYAGGTGDRATRDQNGNITGYTSPDGSGSALGGPSGTPGLDAFHAMNPDVPSSPGFSFLPDSPTPLPGSVAAAVGQPSDGLASAVDTLTTDTRLQTPTAMSVAGPMADGTRRSVSSNNQAGVASWQAGQRTANAAVRSNFKAAGLPDPTIGASVLNVPGGGTAVVPGNLGAQSVPRSSSGSGFLPLSVQLGLGWGPGARKPRTR